MLKVSRPLDTDGDPGPPLAAIEALYLEQLLGLVAESTVIDRAQQMLADGFDGAALSDVCELAALPAGSPRHVEQVGWLLERAVLTAAPDFDATSPACEAHARLKLRELCELGVRERCRPHDIRAAVQMMEVHFDYPAWLGDLWSQTDWIEPSTRWIDVPHLLEHLPVFLAEARAADSSG